MATVDTERQPRGLEEIVTAGWDLAGPMFENMNAATARAVEKLILEAYELGKSAAGSTYAEPQFPMTRMQRPSELTREGMH